MSFIVGLTGGIGSGKSTVADLFYAQGVSVVDTDAIAHELTGAQGLAMPAIRERFGVAVLRPDGALDRVAMRRQVFSDPAAKAHLEDILHPLIRQESIRRCTASGGVYVLLAVPLLVETGAYRNHVDRVLVVDCDEAVQVARVMARSGMTADEVRVIMASQASRARRLAAADDVILNDAGPDALADRVLELHHAYLAYARKKLTVTN